MSHLQALSVLARYRCACHLRTLIVVSGSGLPGFETNTVRDHRLQRQALPGFDRRYDVRKLRYGRLRPVLVVSIAILGLMATAVVPAGAERSGTDGTAKAAAFALNVDVDALGAVPLDVGPLARLRLSGDAGPRFENVVKANVPPLLEALVLATGAETKVGGELASKASARVATVKLKLLGELLIKLLKSECKVKSDLIEVSSDVVFADGSVLGIAADLVGLQARPNSRVYIPAVGSLILNEQIIEKRTSSQGGLIKVTVNALRLELDGILGQGNVTISQSVCKLRGKDVGKNVKIVSTTNGQDTSDEVDDDDGDDGLLGGLLGDGGGLLNVSDLLGGDLLGGGLGGLL